MTKERKNLHDKQFYTNMVMCPDLEQYHKNRAKESLRQLNLLENKFLCHLGCGDGTMTQELSKTTNRILALEINTDEYNKALEKKYDCPIEIHRSDAFEYLEKQSSINPDVFYLWVNYSAMEDWIEKIIELRGHTHPTIILGIGMHKFCAPVDNNGDPVQLLKAKELKEKYQGQIKLTSFPLGNISLGRQQNNGLFGYLILNVQKETI